MPTPSELFVPSGRQNVAESILTSSRDVIQTCPEELLPMAYGLEIWQQSEVEIDSSRSIPSDRETVSQPQTDTEENQTMKFSAATSEEGDEPASPSTVDSKNPYNMLTRRPARNTPANTQSMSNITNSSYLPISSLTYEYSAIRLLPSTTSSFLQSGSKFVGTQQSDKSTYRVSVELKHVDMRESFLCGYLCIKDLTPENPELTTYFEGEIIGNKHTFQTRKKEWGATEKVDYQHWGRFPAYRPYSKAAKKHDYHFKNFEDKEHIFMRWKECFLVPEHSVKELAGASFEGFYYICFSQVTGSVIGYYFHINSEKWQQLDLKHVPDYGCYNAIEFR